jgi:5'(3')-deoxyribonucleotidase
MLIVDMDEVLCDFINPAIRRHGWTRERLESQREGRWSCPEIMGLSNTQFWKPINNIGMTFWHHLPKLPWFEELVDLLDQATDRHWWIATSPDSTVGSRAGKFMWLQAHLPKLVERTFVTGHKAALAKPGRYLIDDRPKNITNFIEEGGEGIIFPHEGNELHAHASCPVPYVAQQLTTLGLLK